MKPSSSDFSTPAEAFTSFDETECIPGERPGVVQFRDWVLQEWGGRDVGITRDCGKTGSHSGHYSGRAWDWGLSVSNPVEKRMADEMIAYLLDNDAEMFRRLGMAYIIWNREIWSPQKSTQWRPYGGPSPHTDHVHFSFGPEGAEGKTSFFSWLNQGSQPSPLSGTTSIIPAFVAGVAAFVGVTALRTRRRGGR